MELFRLLTLRTVDWFQATLRRADYEDGSELEKMAQQLNYGPRAQGNDNKKKTLKINKNSDNTLVKAMRVWYQTYVRGRNKTEFEANAEYRRQLEAGPFWMYSLEKCLDVDKQADVATFDSTKRKMRSLPDGAHRHVLVRASLAHSASRSFAVLDVATKARNSSSS